MQFAFIRVSIKLIGIYYQNNAFLDMFQLAAKNLRNLFIITLKTIPGVKITLLSAPKELDTVSLKMQTLSFSKSRSY